MKFILGGRYSVKECGEVTSFSRRKPKVMKTHITNNGYTRVALYNGQTYEHKTVHSLVARLFVDGYAEGLQVDHIDGDKLNNHYTNLAWVTAQENCVRRTGRIYTCTPTNGIVELTRNLKQFAESHGLSQGNMVQVAQGHRKTAYGWSIQVSNS